jgi:hypothetical protein
MKTAIYIEDGIVQLVITPETEFEKGAVKMLSDKALTAQIFTGSFYDCRGGWVRQAVFYPNSYGSDNQDRSIILRVAEACADSRVEPPAIAPR